VKKVPFSDGSDHWFDAGDHKKACERHKKKGHLQEFEATAY